MGSGNVRNRITDLSNRKVRVLYKILVKIHQITLLTFHSNKKNIYTQLNSNWRNLKLALDSKIHSAEVNLFSLVKYFDSETHLHKITQHTVTNRKLTMLSKFTASA